MDVKKYCSKYVYILIIKKVDFTLISNRGKIAFFLYKFLRNKSPPLIDLNKKI